MNNYFKKENWGKGIQHKEDSSSRMFPKEPGEQQDCPEENRPRPKAETGPTPSTLELEPSRAWQAGGRNARRRAPL